MGKAEKRLQRMRENPRDWRYSQVATTLEAHGFSVRISKGSHRVFKHPSGHRVVLVEAGSGTLLPVYVRKAVEAIDRAAEEKR